MSSFTRFLPSKKFIKIVGIIVVIFLGYFAFLYKKTSNAIKNPEITTITTPVQGVIEKDTDGDGVRDWEEALWGTNPNNQNTFTISDNEYVQQKKNNIINGTKNSGESTPETETDVFAKEFLTTILSLSSSGNLTQENIDALAKKYGENVGQQKSEIVFPYKAVDVKVGSSLLKYRQDLTSALAPYISKKLGNELEIIQTGFDSNYNFTKEEQLKTAGMNYIALSKTLMNIQTPKEIGFFHLLFANNSAILGDTLIAISQINTQPMTGIVAFSNYNRRSNAFTQSLENIVTFLEENGIIK